MSARPKLHKLNCYEWRDYFTPRWIVLDQHGTPLWMSHYWTKAGALRAWKKYGKKESNA